MYTELRDTVTRADFRALTDIVQELAEAQKRTETRVEELVVVQKELAEAQKRTEQSLMRLATTIESLEHRLDDTNKQVGGLANDFGYTLENAAYRALPALLKRDFGIEVEGQLKRGFLPDRKHQGRDIEVNVLGTASQSGKRLMIVGESKSQISKKRFLSYIEEIVPRLDTGNLSPFVVIIAHIETERGVATLARERGAALYFSYDFD
jgi:hypothetical protein